MFKCLECGREFNSNNGLSRHIGVHMAQEEYFDKYLRTSEQEELRQIYIRYEVEINDSNKT